MVSGMIAEKKEAGASTSRLEANWRSCDAIAGCDRLVRLREDEPDEQVVPDEEHLEDRERGDRRDPEREHDLEEEAPLGRAVDPRSLHQVPGDADEEVAQQEDRERQRERGVEEDQPGDRVEEVEVVVEPEDGDQRHLDRHEQEPDDQQEEPVAAGELDPGERVAGQRGNEDRHDRRADRDEHRHPERVRDPLVVEHVGVVLERPGARLRDVGPPAGLRRVGRRQQGGDEEPGGRDQPEDRDQREHDVDRRPLEEADDPGREPRVGIDGGLDRGLDGGVDGGHQVVSARKRRTLTIRKGMKRIRMKVAIAEPSPKRF